MRVLVREEWRPTPEEPRPDVAFVPPLERRRLTGVERAALAVARRALDRCAELFPGGEMPVVFASRWGEIGATERLMRQFHAEGEMSPAGFSNSVHNAAPGHLSRLLGSRAPYTAVAAGPDTYEMGLVEASSRSGRVLFVYAEEETPEFYRPAFGGAVAAHAVAMVLDNPADGEGRA